MKKGAQQCYSRRRVAGLRAIAGEATIAHRVGRDEACLALALSYLDLGLRVIHSHIYSLNLTYIWMK